MNQITLKNFRCFREEQTARLAPLTLLVGENSTGKTSFMAMIRVLWDILYRFRIPDFKEEPYDLGSFDEIAHHRGAGGGRAHTFEQDLMLYFLPKKATMSRVDLTILGSLLEKGGPHLSRCKGISLVERLGSKNTSKLASPTYFKLGLPGELGRDKYRRMNSVYRLLSKRIGGCLPPYFCWS